MQLDNLSFEYWNELARQFILICTFLGGFSLTTVVTLLIGKLDTRLKRIIFKTSVISSLAFLIAIFGMTKILLMTTKGYPLETSHEKIIFPRIISFIAFMIGIASQITVVSLSGWTQSKSLGWFTSIFGFVAALLIFIFLS